MSYLSSFLNDLKLERANGNLGIAVSIDIVSDNAKSHCPLKPLQHKRPVRGDRWQPTPLPSSPMTPILSATTSRWESCPGPKNAASSIAGGNSVPTRRPEEVTVTPVQVSNLTPQLPRRTHSYETSRGSSPRRCSANVMEDDSCHSCPLLSQVSYDRRRRRFTNKTRRGRSISNSNSPPVCPKRSTLEVIEMALHEAQSLQVQPQERSVAAASG